MSRGTPTAESSSAYSDGEIDQEFLRTQSSDILSVVTRLVTLALVYGLMARAIINFDVSAALLLVPIAVEWLATLWMGVVLSRTVVSCHHFRSEANRPGLAVGWTAFVLLIGVIIAAAGHEDGPWLSGALERWLGGGRAVVETGLIWAALVEIGGLALATFPELTRWRTEGGKFMWSAIYGLGMRVAAFILLLVPVFGAIIFMADSGGNLLANPTARAWLAWAILLAVDVAALVITVFMHRDIKRKGARAEPQ